MTDEPGDIEWVKRRGGSNRKRQLHGRRGPIDAQIQWKDKVFSAEAFLEGLGAMKLEAESQGLNKAHIPILQQISPGEIQHAQNALDFAKKLVADWLEHYKFRHWATHRSTGEPVSQDERREAAQSIATALCRH